MSTYYDYAYYMEGRKIAIVRRSSNLSWYIDSGLHVNWETPDAADTDAILFRYTNKVSGPTTETETINVNEYLALAVVDYVRAKVLEDQGRHGEAQKYMNQFYIKIAKNIDNKTGAPNIAIPTGVGVLK